jgi:hypothetical protein
MQRTLVTVAAVLALTGSAFALDSRTGPGASSETPGHEMQDRGSVKGSPGASGYAPGHEMKSDTTGSTRSGAGSSTSGTGTKPGGSMSR